MTVKVLVVSHYYGSHRGGIEITAEYLCRELASRLPCIVHWVATVPPIPAACEGDSFSRIPLRGWNQIEQLTGIPFPLCGPGGLRELWSQTVQADVLMLEESRYMPNSVAFLMARVLRKPIVIVQHGSLVPYDNRFLRVFVEIANRLLACSTMKRAEQVIFISANTMSYFTRRTTFRNPPKLIHNGVDTSIFQPVDTEQRITFRLSLGIGSEKRICLFVGRFVRQKGLQLLSELAASMPDVIWILAGWGPIEPETWGCDNVRVERGRSGETLAPLYQAADLLVLPSVGEGFPLVIQESIACGLPVLCSPETARADPDATRFIFTAPLGEDLHENVMHWRERIYSLLLLPQGFDKDLAYDHAIKHWSWRKTAEDYYQVIMEQAGLRSKAS